MQWESTKCLRRSRHLFAIVADDVREGERVLSRPGWPGYVADPSWVGWLCIRSLFSFAFCGARGGLGGWHAGENLERLDQLAVGLADAVDHRFFQGDGG